MTPLRSWRFKAHDGQTAEELAAALVAMAEQAPPWTPTTEAPADEAPEAEESRPVLTCLADVQPEILRWLWPARIPLGKVSLLFGDPGLGKTFVTLDIAARVSRGMPWPDTAGERLSPGAVILLSAEDDVADTIRPRLDAAGADVRRIVALQGVEYARGGRGYFNLVCDLPALEAAIRQTPDTRLVILDPVSAFLGGTDSHKNAEIRGLLAPLADLAARHDVAVLTVTHMSKGIAGRALYRAMGSLGFIAAARAAWLAIADADNPHRRLFLPAKMNLAEEPSGLAYALESVTLDGIGPVGRVAWESGSVTLTANAALAAAAADPEDRGARDVAADWLREALAAGPMTADDLKAAAKASGLAWRGVSACPCRRLTPWPKCWAWTWWRAGR
ncbi:MAG: AAA family ATPase [Planctomycetota bacterium]|nr:AAA family ATPase [Planctomycetota bacterium]